MLRKAALLLLREDELLVTEHVELPLAAGLDLGLVLGLGIQLGRETRGPLVIAVSDRAVEDADPRHTVTLAVYRTYAIIACVRYRDSFVLLAFSSLAVAWIYGVLNTERTDEVHGSEFWNSGSSAALVGGVLLLTALVIGRWWAPLLALFPAVLALPAGFEPDGYPEVPIWFYLGAQGMIFGIPLMACGVAVRKFAERVIRSS